MTALTYGSVCSGIEAVSVAWEPLGFKPLWFSEIEPFPCAVLAHHWPEVPNLGDMNVLPDLIRAGLVPKPDILVGGTPCQAFSVAGLRNGLTDSRGQLTLKFVELADVIDPQFVVWENVPGVLSDKTNAFGCFLGALAGEDEPLSPPAGKWSNAGVVFGPARTIAWRILDAQYFGVAQRRRRVFVVACPRNGADPTRVLFESEGLCRNTPPSRKKRESVTYDVAPCVTGGGRENPRPRETRGQDCVVAVNDVTEPVTSSGGTEKKHGFGWGQQEFENGFIQPVMSPVTRRVYSDRGSDDTLICMAHGQGRAEIVSDGSPSLTCNHEVPIVTQYGDDQGMNVVAFPSEMSGTQYASGSPSLSVKHTAAIAFSCKDNGLVRAISAQCVATRLHVRRLTPRECERLQGFPDDHTLVPYRGKPAANGPRYKAIGNSMAVPCMAWIGRRLLITVDTTDTTR